MQCELYEHKIEQYANDLVQLDGFATTRELVMLTSPLDIFTEGSSDEYWKSP